jgi:hypothetical protein
MTPAQLTALKNNILANTAMIPSGQSWTGAFANVAINAVPNNSDGNVAIAGWYNLIAVPNFTIWGKNRTVTEIGDKIDATELAGLTTLNNTRLQTLVAFSQNGVNPSLANRRQFFDDVFSGAGGTNTRAALLVLWKEFSTGTGTDVSPATTDINIGQGFTLSADDVNTARNLP